MDKKIVVIDDQSGVVRTVKEWLNSAGYAVESFTGDDAATKALQYMKEHSSEVAIVLTDIVMPNMSGIDLIRELKSLENFPQIKIVAYSGQASSDQVVEGLTQARMDRFLRKTEYQSKETLLRVVEELYREYERQLSIRIPVSPLEVKVTDEDYALISNNNRNLLGIKPPESVEFYDQTLRDGDQTPGVAFTVKQKIDLARALDEIGVAVIDGGFPISSEWERKALTALVELGLRAKISATARALKGDIQCAYDCGVRHVHAFSPTSELHLKYKFGNTSKEEAQKRALEAVDFAKSKGMVVDFVAEDTARSDLEFVVQLFNALHDRGADSIIICDTVGAMNPFSMYEFVRKIRSETNPAIRYGVHCHNDFGLANANTLAAILAGVNFSTQTVNGIGERAGNADFNALVLACELLYGIKTGIDTRKVYELAKMVESYSGILISPTQPVVGANAFTHESGIHVDGMLKKALLYEVINPDLVGRERRYVFGKHSGRNLIERLLDTCGITYTDAQVEEINGRIKKEREARAAQASISTRQLTTQADTHLYQKLQFPEDLVWSIINGVIR